MDEHREKKKKKQKYQHPNEKPISDPAFKLSSDIKGLRFGGQFIVKSFTVRRAGSFELSHLLALSSTNHSSTDSKLPGNYPFRSTTTFLPTNFTILTHHAWHTLTLGLGTKKSKVLVFVFVFVFVFESERMKAEVDRIWPPEIPLGEVNKKLIRGLTRCEMARFKFRKGCITFYVYAVRQVGSLGGFTCANDLRTILQSVVELKDFLDHTAMLALPSQRHISFSPPVAMAHYNLLLIIKISSVH